MLLESRNLGTTDKKREADMNFVAFKTNIILKIEPT